MLVVGLTGGIGSGKSAASEAFAKLGRPIIDADVVAREVVEPGEEALAKIAEHFGEAVLQDDGHLNRAMLRDIVFQESKHREWLEQLLHPIIRTRIMDKLESYQGQEAYAILASPLLLETDQHKLVDHIIVVDIEEALQVKRTSERDGNTPDQVERIMAAQLSRAERAAKADSLLDNNTTREALEQQVATLDKKLRSLAAEEYQA